MKIKEEQFLLLDEKLPPTDQAKVKRMLERKVRGFKQNAKGDLRQAVTNDFLAMFRPEQVQKLEENIKRLQSIKTYKKFRTEVVTLLIDLYIGALFSSEFSGGAAKKNILEMFKKHNIEISW